MRQFIVKIPVTGYVQLMVEAEDMESAIDKAVDMATLDDIEEWDLHKRVVTGNISNALLNEIQVFEED